MNTERWVPVVGYELVYEVSDEGRVRRQPGYVKSPRAASGWRLKKGGELKPAVIRGYQSVNLCKDGHATGRKVHILVADAFIGLRPFGKTVNHKDGKKSNNRPDNLEYVSIAENNQHAYDVCGKRYKMPRGEKNHYAKLVDVEVIEIRRLRNSGLRLRVIAEQFGICIQSVANIAKRKSWTHI
jgi:HNH endonuclease/NUMOD4 motif